MNEIVKNLLTVRAGDEIMPHWFSGKAKILFAQNIANDYNINESGLLLEKIGVHCYTPKGLNDRFGIDPEAPYYYYNYDNEIVLSNTTLKADTANIIPMSPYLRTINAEDNHSYFEGKNERLGILLFAGNYYVAASNANEYSFSMIENIKTNIQNKTSVQTLFRDRTDVHVMFLLYHIFKEQNNKPSCDNGN